MKLFLDTSVLLAAVGSAIGASREIFRRAEMNHWQLLSTPYVVDEVLRNLPVLPDAEAWPGLRSALVTMEDIVTLDRIVVFGPAKDRPILFSALAWADVLLTLDRTDFGGLMTGTFYGLAIRTPGSFLEQERAMSRLI